MNKNTLSIGIIVLFIISSISPMVFGNNNTITEEDKLLDNLAFMCSNEYGSLKYEYLKERLLNDIPDCDIVESEKPVETESTIIPSGGPMNSPWPTFCHDNHHTSLSPYSNSNVTSLEKWRFYTPGWVQGSAVIDNNGIIYLGDFDGRINAVYPNGTLIWIYKADHWVQSTPAIAEDGTIYAGSWDTALYALNPNGTKKWRVTTGGSITDSPAIGNDGTIYIGNMNNIITAIYPNGTKKWTYKTGDFVSSAPAIGDDDMIYIGSADSYLYAFYPNGTLRWRYKTGGIIKGSPSIADDGTIYVGSFDDYVHAIYPNNGTRIWKCKVGGGTETNPSIGPDGTIYVGGEKLYAINPDGTLKWSFDLGPERWVQMSSPCISSDGTIYIGTNIGLSGVEGGDIIAVNPDGTERWRKKICDNGWVDSSPLIGPDGTVYIGSSQDWDYSYLHAFGPVDSNSPPESPVITGETDAKVGDELIYTFKAFDPDNNPIRYYIEWGDGKIDDWCREHASNQKYEALHVYTEKGNYTISAKVRDVFDEESGWGTFNVTIIKKSKDISSSLFLRFLERYPLLALLLQKLAIF